MTVYASDGEPFFGRVPQNKKMKLTMAPRAILTLVHLRYFLKYQHPTWGHFDPSLFYL